MAKKSGSGWGYRHCIIIFVVNCRIRQLTHPYKATNTSVFAAADDLADTMALVWPPLATFVSRILAKVPGHEHYIITQKP